MERPHPLSPALRGFGAQKPEAHRLTCAKRTSENMEASVHGLYTRLTSWLVQVETVFAPLQSAKVRR